MSKAVMQSWLYNIVDDRLFHFILLQVPLQWHILMPGKLTDEWERTTGVR